jgi:CHAD domain-containing protein
VAKARDIPLEADEPYAQAAARVVRTRADEVFEHAEGVLDVSDIERVHAMRVATRRLRAVLEIFAPCFPKALYRDVLGDVKRLADALGQRRDPDVHLEAFAGRDDIGVLIEHLRERQAHGNTVLAAELERVEETRLRERLAQLADEAAVA